MVKLLDCTLRDGGYVNNWFFGKDNIVEITRRLEETNVNIIEMGFLKDESYVEDRTVFNSVEQISNIIQEKKLGIEYAAMIDAMNPIPLDRIRNRDDNTVDIIRVMVWKSRHDENNNIVDCLKDGYKYCKQLVEKGYKLCIQPARVDQYSDEEFIKMIKLYQKLEPLAIYVVDSWGTLETEQVMHYVALAEKAMKPEIAIGYHGHNNMLQAYRTAVEFANYSTDRDLIIDASIYGIGRCAGNLNLEIIANYMNRYKYTNYLISPMISICEDFIKAIRNNNNWGYSIPYLITGKNNCHPNYANYLCFERGMDSVTFEKLVNRLGDDDKVLFTKRLADQYANDIYLENAIK